MGDFDAGEFTLDGAQTSVKYFENAKQVRVDTEAAVLSWLSAEYSNMKITVVRENLINLKNYAEKTGEAHISEIDSKNLKFKLTSYRAPTTRLSDSAGDIVVTPNFVAYRYLWKGNDFLLVVVEGIRSNGIMRTQHIVSDAKPDAQVEVDNLIREVGLWQSQLHNETWVFEFGAFRKDAGLYDSVMKASWDDVILHPEMKKDLQDTVNQFFDAEDTYHSLRVPWKRGLIFYGPPGNGKTISLKATMRTLYKDRSAEIPTIYVKTMPNAQSVTTVFGMARRQAPCLVILEDIDSLVSPDIRSLFLNAVDGLSENDGILIIGTTNHLEQLDPGIAKRPSRFDRKYMFPDPNFDNRVQYCTYWQKRLKNAASTIEFPDQLCPAVARKTGGFSFAYIQEAFLSALLAIARMGGDGSSITEAVSDLSLKDQDKGRDDEDKDLDQYLLWRVIKKQIENLRKEMSKDDSETL